MSDQKTNVPELVQIEDIPGYKEAQKKESRRRLVAFFDDGLTVCGFKVNALTLRRLLRLELASSPFLSQGAVVTERDLDHFLWAMSPDFCESERKRIKFHRRCRRSFYATKAPGLIRRPVWAYSEAKRQARFNLIVQRVLESLRDDHADMSIVRGSSKEKSYYHGIVSVVSLLMRSQGFTYDEAMDKPLGVVVQFMREAREHAAFMHYLNSDSTDKFRSPLSNPESESVVLNFCKEKAKAAQ